MKPIGLANEGKVDSFDLDSMAVGPYCLFDDLVSNDTSQRESLSPPTGDVSVVREGDIDGMEYPFLDGQAWPVTSAEVLQFNRTQSPHVIPNGTAPNNGWEDFMQWNPGQSQDLGRTSDSAARSASGVNHGQSLYTRRAGTISGQPSLELGSDGHAAGSREMPFNFGQAMSIAPPFEFTSPGSMISPLAPHGLPTNAQNGVASRSPIESTRTSMISPFSHDGQFSGVMPPPPVSTSSLRQSPSSNRARMETSESVPSSPEEDTRRPNLKKRKSDDSDEIDRDSRDGPPKKTAHNMIEKRYRTNLNDKIAALRDSVPSLRIMSKTTTADEDDDAEDLEGLAPAHKLNKATVLSKATEYIRHLEKRNKKLQDEMMALKKQMNSYEKLSMNTFAFPGSVGTPDGVAPYDQHSFDHVPPRNGVQNPVQGMIGIPEDLRRMRESTVMQPAYGPGTSTPQYPSYVTPTTRPSPPGQHLVNGRGSNFMNRLMVGSLAGLMLFEGFVEREKSGEEPEGRGLFAVPVSLLSEIGSSLWPKTLFFGASPYEAIALLKFCLIIGAAVHVLLPLLDFKPRPKKKPATIECLRPVESIAYPIDHRRRAWLTAICTVWVPQHQFVLEAAALLLKTLKLSTRKLIGWQGYAFLWNVTKDQEEARVKAWDIALDAQLTGGDAEISMSRLILTLLASGTLPDTPHRLMLKALHIRVLLWEVAKAGYGTWYMFDELSLKLARRYWNQARLEHKMYTNSPSRRDAQHTKQELPAHLEALLELDCDQVLVKPIIQRAYNLAWNRPSSENSQPDESTDSVVEDFAISSPLDALAAWLSSLVINNVLEHSLLLDESRAVLKNLETAIAIAPPTSSIQARALATKALLIKKDRLQLVESAYKMLPQPQDLRKSSNSDLPLSPLPSFLLPRKMPRDIPVALVLAKCLALVEKLEQGGDDTAASDAEVHDHAVAALLRYRPTETGFSILSFAAAYRVMDHFVADPVLRREARPILERMANAMRVWIGKEAGKPAVAALSPRIRTKVVERCIVASKILTGVKVNESDVEDESDAGYGSLEEEMEKR